MYVGCIAVAKMTFAKQLLCFFICRRDTKSILYKTSHSWGHGLSGWE